MKRLIFGCGYLGERAARSWRDVDDEVFVVTRSRTRAETFTQRGYTAIVADVTRPETLANLPMVDTVLFAVGHDRDASASIEEVYTGGMRNVLDAMPANLQRFIYISTTGVYGPAGGEWVDESTPPDPQRNGGRASLAAEQLLREHSIGGRSVILRLAGIYGPERIPFLNELRAGRPVEVPSSGYLNLIHVSDAAAAILASGRLGSFDDGPRIYCVSDGQPVERESFYREVARLLGAPTPHFAEAAANSPRAERARGNRRVSNDKMRAQLHAKLQYPNYRSGLAAALEIENQ